MPTHTYDKHAPWQQDWQYMPKPLRREGVTPPPALMHSGGGVTFHYSWEVPDTPNQQPTSPLTHTHTHTHTHTTTHSHTHTHSNTLLGTIMCSDVVFTHAWGL